jgi:hypothetical protein
MKPKTKFQKQVVEAQKTLSPITKKQIQWSYDNVIEYVGRRTKRGIITCTKCGYSWRGAGHLVATLTDCHCPNCQAKLTVKTTGKRIFDGSYYMTIITAHKGYQVLRTIVIKCREKVGETAKYSHSEVMQRWIAPNGKYATFAKLRQTMGSCYYYCDLWIFHTSLELRRENNVYDRIFTGEVYSRQKLIPELKRAGYKKGICEAKPFDMFHALLSDNRMETLLKTGQMELFKLFLKDKNRKISDYWASVRICNRNSYIIEDASLWCDYIKYLRYFGKDLHNAKYVCPSDLHKEHNRYMDKKVKAEAQKEIEKLREKETDFAEAKGKFFGILFSDGTITVRVLESIEEMILEGKFMHHCVGDYYSKADSLILSATIDGKRIETVEISLSKLAVIQSRGVCNKNTEYHDRILKLVKKNMCKIRKRITA